jgi:hypothetical protein
MIALSILLASVSLIITSLDLLKGVAEHLLKGVDEQP